jgi:hypothetical protein
MNALSTGLFAVSAQRHTHHPNTVNAASPQHTDEDTFACVLLDRATVICALVLLFSLTMAMGSVLVFNIETSAAPVCGSVTFTEDTHVAVHGFRVWSGVGLVLFNLAFGGVYYIIREGRRLGVLSDVAVFLRAAVMLCCVSAVNYMTLVQIHMIESAATVEETVCTTRLQIVAGHGMSVVASSFVLLVVYGVGGAMFIYRWYDTNAGVMQRRARRILLDSRMYGI